MLNQTLFALACVPFLTAAWGCKTAQTSASTPADGLAVHKDPANDNARVLLAATAAALPENGEAAATPIYFSFDSADLLPAAQVALKTMAETLRQRPELAVIIEGHCDERGTVEYNMALGDRRAAAARDYLVRMGVGRSRLQVLSYGEERPAESGADENALAKNRRDEFVLTHRPAEQARR